MQVTSMEKSSKATVMIRRAQLNDVESIHAFVCALEEEEFEYTLFKKLYIQNLENKNNIYLVAVENEYVIGYISCHGQLLLHHLGMVYEIEELFIDAAHRNKKAGSLLLRSLEEIIGKTDYKSIEVTSNKKRSDAHRFYLENGFTQSHVKFTKSK